MAKIGVNQVDIYSAHLEATGVNTRQIGIKSGAIDPAKLGFSWETVDIAASAFTDAGSDLWTETVTVASSQANVEEMAQLSRNGVILKEKVTTPSANGEWSLSGTTLTVYWDGTLTSTEDEYQLRYIIASSGGAGTGLATVSCRIYDSNATQSIDSSASTAVTFDSERWDTDGLHSTSSNTSRITFQRSGKYVVGGNVRWDNNATGLRSVAIRLNGSTFLAYTQDTVVADSEEYQQVSCLYDFSVDDYIELVVYQTSGGSLDLLSYANTAPEFWSIRISEGISALNAYTNGTELQAARGNSWVITHNLSNQFAEVSTLFMPASGDDQDEWINAESVLTVRRSSANSYTIYNDSGTAIASGRAKVLIHL